MEWTREEIEDFAHVLAYHLVRDCDPEEELVTYMMLAWEADPDLMRDDIETAQELTV